MRISAASSSKSQQRSVRRSHPSSRSFQVRGSPTHSRTSTTAFRAKRHHRDRPKAPSRHHSRTGPPNSPETSDATARRHPPRHPHTFTFRITHSMRGGTSAGSTSPARRHRPRRHGTLSAGLVHARKSARNDDAIPTSLIQPRPQPQPPAPLPHKTNQLHAGDGCRRRRPHTPNGRDADTVHSYEK